MRATNKPKSALKYPSDTMVDITSVFLNFVTTDMETRCAQLSVDQPPERALADLPSSLHKEVLTAVRVTVTCDFHLEQTSGSGWLGMWYSIAQWFRWLLAQCFPKTWSWTGIPALRGQRGSFNSSNPLEEEWEHCWSAAAYWTMGPTLRFKHTHTHTHTHTQTLCDHNTPEGTESYVYGYEIHGGPLLGSHRWV